MQIRKKILSLPLRLGVILVIVGALFKIMHWPGSNILMLVGFISIGVLYSIRFLKKDPKLRLDYVKLILVLLWLVNYTITVFHLYKIPFLLEICVAILFCWWFIEEGSSYLTNREFKKKGTTKIVYYTLVGISTIGLVGGIFFKIQHWPYGSVLFLVLTFCVVILVDYFCLNILLNETRFKRIYY